MVCAMLRVLKDLLHTVLLYLALNVTLSECLSELS